MPLTPIAGSIRLRAFQLGKETTFKTQVAATRRMPWALVPVTDPHWTFTTADTGTLDEAIAPYRLATDITGTATGELFSNDVPTIISAGVLGGLSLTGGGTAKTITGAPASTSQDVFDTYTAEWFDDATGDAFAYTGGIIEKFVLTYPQNLGPIQASVDWRFANVVYPATPTGSLSVDAAPVPLFMADTVLSVDSAAGSIGISPLLSQVHDITVTYTNNIDVKRFANGSNTRFQVAGYGRGARMVEVAVSFAKATGAIAEVTNWLNANPVERFIDISTTSTVNAQASTPHSLRIRMGGYWFTRTEQTINSNSAFQLVGRNIYDTTLGYPFQMQSVSTRTAL